MPYADRERQRRAQREWVQEKRDADRPAARSYRSSIRRRNEAFVNALKSVPCNDCGETYPYFVMDFDHLVGTTKLAEISRLVRDAASLETLRLEIAKCEVVCANCHRIRTWNRKHNLLDPAGEGADLIHR